MSNTTHQEAHPEKVLTESLRVKALELRIAGASYRQIATTLAIAASTAHDYVTGGVADLEEHSLVLKDEYRKLELARLDALLLGLWPKRTDVRTHDSILRNMERRARLLGLDAPVRWEGSGPGGGPIPVAGDIDLTKLTLEQLDALEQIVMAATLLPLTVAAGLLPASTSNTTTHGTPEEHAGGHADS